MRVYRSERSLSFTFFTIDKWDTYYSTVMLVLGLVLSGLGFAICLHVTDLVITAL